MFANKFSKIWNSELLQIDEQKQYNQIRLETFKSEELAQNSNQLDEIVENKTEFESSSGNVEKTRNNTQGLINDFFKHLRIS